MAERHRHRTRAGLVRWALLALGFVLLSACDHPAQALPDWQLRGVGAVRLPGQLPVSDRDQVYVLSAEVELAPALVGHDLDFVIPRFWANTELWVDGQQAVRVGERRAGPVRTTTPHVYRVSAALTRKGRIALSLHVAHRWTQSAWLDTVPRLVRARDGDPAARRATLFDGPISLCAIATLLQIGLAAQLVFALGGRRREYLWFGIQAMAAALYPAFVYGTTQWVFGRELEVAVTASGLIIAVWASARFSYAFFDLGRVPRWVDALTALGVLISTLGHAPYQSTRAGGSSASLSVGLAVVLQCTLCVRMTLVAERRHDARWYLACWLALALTSWNEIVTWVGLGDVFGGPRVACAGLMAFAFFMSLLLSQRHLNALAHSDRLNLELAARVVDLTQRGVEIAGLNTELRRQIAERSEQIYAALALRDRKGGKVSDLTVGDIVQGRYRVLGLRGAGGMGAVYEVERVRDGAHLALKLTRESSGSALALLAREAQIAAQLQHENVVRVLDVDIASTLGVLYIVMELVEGQTLSELTTRFGDVPWALNVLHQVASGLSVLHAAGIVHRDIKPANIMVIDANDAARLRVKITDFGVAKQGSVVSLTPPPEHASEGDVPASEGAESGDEIATEVLGPGGQHTPVLKALQRAPEAGSFTREGLVVGTPLYMAPELIRPNTPATSAADMYAFGVLACELLTGQRPFAKPQALMLFTGDTPEPIPELATRVPELAAEVGTQLSACLSLDPDKRPTAAQLAELLRSSFPSPSGRGLG